MRRSFEKDFSWQDYFIISEDNFIRQKEHSEIEFKESFHNPRHKDKKLLKWIASFANAKGGLILYGIKNNGEITGLTDSRMSDFDNKDLTQELLDYFSPMIEFELFTKDVHGFQIGFLYIYESTDKPVVAIKSANNNIQECDIFYRYPGQSRKISYGELRNILEDKHKDLNSKWMKLIQGVATIGVENVGLLNVVNGELIGSRSTLLISDELLSKIQFINEGSFVEKDGAPTLKLIGDVQPIGSNRIIQVVEKKYQIITHFELYNSFFEQKIDSVDAKEFFRKVLHENTAYYPLYFFLVNSGLSNAEIKDFIAKEQGIRKIDVIKRMRKEKDNIRRFEIGNLNTETEAAKNIMGTYKKLKNKEPFVIKTFSSSELRHCIQAITHLKEHEIDLIYICSLLKDLYDKHFNSLPTTKSFIRKAICHIDLVVFGREFFKTNKASQSITVLKP